MKFLVILLALGSAACSAKSENPTLACQQRISEARLAGGDSDKDAFGASAYKKIDRKGCSAEQVAEIKALYELAVQLPVLMDANEEAGASGNEATHMQAFQEFNNALIQMNALQDAATEKLAKMKSAQD
jgi:hypothetical protein